MKEFSTQVSASPSGNKLFRVFLFLACTLMTSSGSFYLFWQSVKASSVGADSITNTLTTTLTTTLTSSNTFPSPGNIQPNLVPTQSVSNASNKPVSTTLQMSLTQPIPQSPSLSDSKVPVTVTQTSPASVTTTLSTNVSTNPDSLYSSIISGTILANRTQSQVRFFVEGATYLLDPFRSIGIELPRSSAALNLYNCDAQTPETQAGCYWDPYLLTKDGFYEIISGNHTGETTNLVIHEASTPPTNQIWVHNRTGQAETIFIYGQSVELPSATVKELPVPANTPTLIYLPNCVAVNAERVCEWAPRNVEPGHYYALVEAEKKGDLPNSQLSSLELESLLAQSNPTVPVEGAAQEETTAAEATQPGNEQQPTAQPQEAAPTQPLGEIKCRTLVPAVNVRSGPGLQYTIIQKVRISNDNEPATILVVGRDSETQWLAVAERIATGGWVVASANFVACEGDLTALPVIQPTIAQLIPTPSNPSPTPTASSPVAQQPEVAIAPPADAPIQTTPAEGGNTQPAPTNPTAEDTSVTTPTVPSGVPAGYAVLVVNNGFDKDIRFTIDQRYRVEAGVSEYDLPPGGSVRFVIFPGQIAFSVSSPWNGLSGNADLFVDKDQARTLWFTFIPDAGDPNKWELKF